MTDAVTFRVVVRAEAKPILTCTLQGAQVVLAWPSSFAGYQIEFTDALGPRSAWTLSTTTPIVDGAQFKVIIPVAGAHRFFRLTSSSGPGAPSISAIRVGGNLVLAWPDTFTGYVVESRDDLRPGSTWRASSTPIHDGNQFKMTEPISGGKQFYRLRTASP